MYLLRSLKLIDLLGLNLLIVITKRLHIPRFNNNIRYRRTHIFDLRFFETFQLPFYYLKFQRRIVSMSLKLVKDSSLKFLGL